MGSKHAGSKRWSRACQQCQMPVGGIVDGVGGGETVSSVDETGWKVEEEERRPRWRLMALVAGFDGSGKRRWMLVAVAGSGKVAVHGDRGGCRVVMVIEIDTVDGDGGKGVEVMGSSVEETALAVWAGERGRRRERRWTLLVVVVVVGRGDDDAHRRL